MSTSIVIADSHPLILRGLTDMLTSKGFNIVGSATDGNSAYNLIVKFNPQIAILDIQMSHKTGLEIAEACNKNNLDTKIILITSNKNEALYNTAKTLNIYGYILKEFTLKEIETCIKSVVNNTPYFSNKIISYLKKGKDEKKIDALNYLTKSELKIIKLISQKRTSQEIAEELSISIRTVEKHRSNIVAKLNLDDKPTSLVLWASLNKKHL